MADAKKELKHSKLFNKQHSECSYNDPKPVCSPTHIIEKMKDFHIKKTGKPAPHITEKTNHASKSPGDAPHQNHHIKIVEDMKTILNCESESCLLRNHEFVNFVGADIVKNILTNFFKPEGPAKTKDLLSNFDIDGVLSRLKKEFPERKFLHIPFQMRDFQTVGTSLATIDLAQKMRDGYKTFGTVLNTDYSTGPGIHWYCIFGENYGDHIDIEYFNSSGKPPLEETQIWLQKTKHHLEKELNLPVSIRYTTGIQYQFDDHSCGVYCLSYIWGRLEKIPFNWFRAENFDDKLMRTARSFIFIPSS
jgi:hypothetical protein